MPAGNNMGALNRAFSHVVVDRTSTHRTGTRKSSSKLRTINAPTGGGAVTIPPVTNTGSPVIR